MRCMSIVQTKIHTLMIKNTCQRMLQNQYPLRKYFLLINLSLFYLVLSSASLFATGSYAQKMRLQLNLKNASLMEAFKAIEQQSEFTFLYSSDEVNVDKTVSISGKSLLIEDILDKLLEGSGVTYKITDRHIVLHKNVTGELYARSSGVAAQTQGQRPAPAQVITGKITDAKGEPIPLANVMIKGTSIVVLSTEEGTYAITIPSDISAPTLLFSFIGFTEREEVVGSRSVINVTLSDQVSQLDEVVVVGFGVQKKATMTGAISTIASDNIARSSATTASGALVGKIAGLNSRMSDGRPGSYTKLNIRNMGTPLFVIDGIQSNEEQFNNIDFNDIENISVMKDASAAIYGVRAANGVIVVTTKRGHLGEKNTINLNGYYGWQSMFKFPRPADAPTYVRSYIQSDAITNNPTPKFTVADLEKWERGTEKGYRPFDWYDYILNTSPQYYIGGNTSGGSEKINYYFAMSHINQQSIIVNYGGFHRTNVQMNLDAQISKRIKLGGTFSGRIDKDKHPGVPGGDDTWQALFAIYRNLPTARPFANDNPNYPARTSADAATNFGMLNYDKSGIYEKTRRVMNFNVTGTYDILDGLKLKGQVGYNLNNEWLDNHEYTYKLYDYDELTDTYPVNFSMDNPWRERRISMTEEFMTLLQLTFDKTIGLHALNAVAAAESYKLDAPNFWVHARPATNEFGLLDTQTVDEFNDYGRNTQARLGYIGRINYNYAQKYLIEVSARYDGSWKFPPEHRWGFFPSSSVGWRISEEDFWKNSSINHVINNLKIRASYGLLGDDDLGNKNYMPFDYMGGYDYGTYRNSNGDEVNTQSAAIDGKWVIGAKPRGLPVTSISWLKSRMFNAGVDFSFFKGKLTGTLDYFRRMRTGLPASRYDVLIPKETGFDLPKENLNSDLHTGIDGMFLWRDNLGEFEYTAGVNFTYARQFDWEQYRPRFGNSWDNYRNSIYKRYAFINWGYHAIGQFQSWEEIANYPIDNDQQGNKSLRPGDIKYEDVNGDGIINNLDERPIGYREGELPYLNFGFNLGFAYKGFDLSIDLTGAMFASYTFDWEARNPFHDGGNNPQYYMDNQWKLSDITDPNSALIPGKYPTLRTGNGSHSNYWRSDFWTRNVNYIKIRNLDFGYTLPKKWSSKMGVSKLRVNTFMQNLFSIDNLGEVDMDPELSGGSGVQYPTNRVINFGVSMTF